MFPEFSTGISVVGYTNQYEFGNSNQFHSKLNLWSQTRSETIREYGISDSKRRLKTRLDCMGYEQLSCEVREERPLTTKIGNGKPCFSFARQCCHLGARLQTTTCCFDPAKKLTRTIMSGVNPLLLLTDSCISRVRTNTTMNGVTKMALKVKKLSEHAFIPTRGSPFSAGYDLYSAYDCVVPARGKQLVKTDIAIAVPMDHYGRVAPRSGLAWKNSIDVGAGVIDYDYRGNVGVILFNHSDDEFKVSKGDRVAQLVLERISTPDVIEVNELDETQRSDGGFGSTGVSL